MNDQSKTLFVFADPHGCFTPMKAALDDAGFDPADPSHLLVCLGDLFDRGSENEKVLDYLSDLPQKVLIRGNHDTRLSAILNGAPIEGYDETNSTAKTLTELFGAAAIADGRFHADETNDKLRKLRALLASTVHYFEWGEYVFTHGWLPTDDGIPPTVLADWRNATEEQWDAAEWSEWQQYYGAVAIPEGKTLVCGHRTSRLAHLFDPTRFSDDYSPFYGDHLIALDSGTPKSGIVNVLTLRAK